MDVPYDVVLVYTYDIVIYYDILCTVMSFRGFQTKDSTANLQYSMHFIFSNPQAKPAISCLFVES